jgi:hypothetical protein
VQREKLLAHFHNWQTRHGGNSAAFGFHYTLYAFASNPELSFFEQLFGHVGLHAEQVQDKYFTGAMTAPQKSDFL